MPASIDALAPFVDETIFALELSAEWKDSHYCFHLDYEAEVYRQKALIRLIRDSVEYFALTHEEFEEFRAAGDLPSARRAAWSRISTARKDKKGDYGELLLFLLLSFKMPQRIPRFVTKVRLRSSRADQIKGFDCAHVTLENGQLHLWLGEAKFHQTISNAVSSVVTSLTEHCSTEYLRNELKILGANIEANYGIDGSIEAELNKALNKDRSIDRLHFKIPVLLTYDSKSVNAHKFLDDTFRQKLKDEVERQLADLADKFEFVPKNFSIIFLLMPLAAVAEIKAALEDMESAME